MKNVEVNGTELSLGKLAFTIGFGICMGKWCAITVQSVIEGLALGIFKACKEVKKIVDEPTEEIISNKKTEGEDKQES